MVFLLGFGKQPTVQRKIKQDTIPRTMKGTMLCRTVRVGQDSTVIDLHVCNDIIAI